MIMNDAQLLQGRAGETAATGSVTVLYFARLKEAFGSGQEQIPLTPSMHTVQALLEHLRSRGGAWERELGGSRPVRVAVNQEMARADTPISPSDEVAFFPPVTGG